MNGNYNKASIVLFLVGYLLLYYLTVWLNVKIFSDAVMSSWTILGEYSTKMKAVIIISPIVGIFFGTFAASVSVMSYTAMGSDRLLPSKFFGIGWFCIIISNLLTNSVALQLCIDKKIGKAWIDYLGSVRFNACIFLLAPSLGFIGGVGAVILLQHIIQSQNS